MRSDRAFLPAPAARPAALVAAAALLLFSVACGGKRPATTSPGYAQGKRYVEQGVASWYGHPYHGRQTASGERFDMHGKTAAHRTLPFGLVATVTNLDNGRKVRVRINDRGPFVEGRILDLSKGAAKQLGMIEAGLARVRIEIAP